MKNSKITNLQQSTFDKLSALKVGALFIKMGLGKTKIAIDLIDYNKCDFLIYVAPFQVLATVEAEFKKWGLKTPYRLVAYETISMSDKTYLELLNLDYKKMFIVADESIFIKNETSKRFCRLLTLRNKCEYALILNGTPLTKNEWDIYNQMEFLSPLIINMSRSQFNNTFFKMIKIKKNRKWKTFYEFSQINAEVLYKLIAPYIVYNDMDLGIIESDIINLIDCDLTNYYYIKECELKKMKDEYSFERICSLLVTLNGIASCCTEKNTAVINYCKNKQIIVYCAFLDEYEYLTANMGCYGICGSTPKKDRTKIFEAFEKDNKPLVMTYGVGSYGLNLQFCNEIVLSSILFDYGKVEQSKHRIKRFGQEKEIKYTYILTRCGINHLITENLNKKQDLKKLIENHIKDGDISWLKSI